MFQKRFEHFLTERLPVPFLRGEVFKFQFPNGFGASVAKHDGTNSSWELAVIDSLGEIDYSTPVTNDVLRLSEEEVETYLQEIADLPMPEGLI